MRALALVAVLLPSVAAAQPVVYSAPPPSDVITRAPRARGYEPGIVPEGMNAFIGRKKNVHLSLLGTSHLTVGADTEIATYLLGDVLLFPNLRVEHQLSESETSAASIMIGAGAGALPVAFAGVLPFPGIAFAGAGVAWGSAQSATFVVTGRSPSRGLAVSVNAGGFALEGGFVAAGAAVGGGGAAAAATSDSTHRFGETTGVELDKTFGSRNALVVAVDAWRINPHGMSEASGVLYPRVTLSHRFERFQVTGGAYALFDMPKFNAAHSKMPVGPFMNIAWNYGR